VNEQIAGIERENRAFWLRLLRERFDRDVTLEVDWEAFERDSSGAGWPLYPLNIQQAGIERLLYALSGLMDKNEKFRVAAKSSINSIQVTSARDIRAVKLSYQKGRITYCCFAGDWNGYFTIEQMQQYLHDSVASKCAIRRRLEQWLSGFFAAKDQDEGTECREQKIAQTEIPTSKGVDREPELIVHDQTAREGPSERTIPPYDAELRSELESLYNAFLKALKDKNLERLLDLVCTTKTDEETLRNEMEKDGFASFSEWLLTAYPTLEQANYVALKTKAEDLAGYYMEWLPPYTRDYLNLTLVKYLKINGQWKVVFRLTEMPGAPFQVRKDEEPLVKALEVIATNPLMALDRPEFLDDPEKPAREPKLTKKKARLREELETVITAVQKSLEQRDAKTFLSAVAASQKDGKTLRKKFSKLSKEILKNTPDPSKATFISLETAGSKTVGYYFVAPHPKNPAFRFVYLRPFVRRAGQWRLVFSLEHDLGVSLNVAKSGGDLISRANEVIREIPLLHLNEAMESTFEDVVKDNPS
jgi:hypothetical protein